MAQFRARNRPEWRTGLSLGVVRCHLARGVGRLLDLVVGATSPSLPPACRPDRGGASLRERAYGIALIYLTAPGAPKSRSTRSGAGRASRSRLVVHARPRRPRRRSGAGSRGGEGLVAPTTRSSRRHTPGQVTPNDTSGRHSGRFSPFFAPGTVPCNPSESCQSCRPIRPSLPSSVVPLLKGRTNPRADSLNSLRPFGWRICAQDSGVMCSPRPRRSPLVRWKYTFEPAPNR